MRFYLDTEFQDTGKSIELISIALVSERGDEFYAVSSEFNTDDADDWVKKNVLTKLPPFDMLDGPPGETTWDSRVNIAESLRAFVSNLTNTPEFWAYFADYDWVVLCQLFGGMLKLPKGWPQLCLDLKQEMMRLGVSKKQLPPQSESHVHDALSDARWVCASHLAVRKFDTTPR